MCRSMATTSTRWQAAGALLLVPLCGVFVAQTHALPAQSDGVSLVTIARSLRSAGPVDASVVALLNPDGMRDLLW